MIYLRNGHFVYGSGSELQICDKTPQFIQMINAHSDFISSLIQLKNGSLVSVSRDKKIKIWDIPSYQCLTSIEAHSQYVDCILQLQDGKLFAVGENKITVLHSITFKTLKESKADSITDHLFVQLEDGRLVSCNKEGWINEWSLEPLECIKSIKGHSRRIDSLIQLKDGRLVSGCNEGLIKVWDSSFFKCLNSFQADSSKIISLIQLNDGRLISGGVYLKFWDVSSMKCIKSIEIWASSLIKMEDDSILYLVMNEMQGWMTSSHHVLKV